MPSFCGLHIHLSHRGGCKSSAQPDPIVNSTWKPPRPPREDGPYGLPVRPYPPVRSPLRHASPQVSRDRRPSDPGCSIRSVIPLTLAEQFDERYPEVMAPVPVPPRLFRDAAGTQNHVTHESLRRGSDPDWASTPRQRKLSTENWVLTGEYPRYGPASRPPVALSSLRDRAPRSTSRASRRTAPGLPQPRDTETGRVSSAGRGGGEWGLPDTRPPSRPLPRTPPVPLTPVVTEFHDASRYYSPGDEPIYFLPESLSPVS